MMPTHDGLRVPLNSDNEPKPTVRTVGNVQARQEYLWKIDEYLANYARFSDTKAAFIGATGISLFGWMLSQHLLSRGLQTAPAAWPIALWLAAAAAIFLLGSMAFAIWAVYPRLRGTRKKGIVFWADIATYPSAASFTSTILTMSAEERASELAQHIYDVAVEICIPKFRYVAVAIWLFVLGALSLGTSLMLRGVHS